MGPESLRAAPRGYRCTCAQHLGGYRTRIANQTLHHQSRHVTEHLNRSGYWLHPDPGISSELLFGVKQLPDRTNTRFWDAGCAWCVRCMYICRIETSAARPPVTSIEKVSSDDLLRLVWHESPDESRLGVARISVAPQRDTRMVVGADQPDHAASTVTIVIGHLSPLPAVEDGV